MMDRKEYWKLGEKERKEQDKIDAKDNEPMVRYYIWEYCRSYGWRMSGNQNGYDTFEKLTQDSTYQFNLKDGTVMKILKAVEVQ